MRVSELENLADRLRNLRAKLAASNLPGDKTLTAYDSLVREAAQCEFMLPSPLTVRTLSETVERKIENLKLLLERARMHEALPESAQAAAEQEYLLSEREYFSGRTYGGAAPK